VTASTYLVGHDAAQAGRLGAEAVALSAEQGLPVFDAGGRWLTGYALVAEGETKRGLQVMREAALSYHATGAQNGLIYFALLAEVFVDIGRIDDALLIAGHALVRSNETGEHMYRAELLRIQGEALLRQAGDHESEAEPCFSKAVELARHQGSRIFELRAAMSLVRLWLRRGRRAAARERLEETLRRCDDQFEGADGRAAHSLLESIS
jgi:predicted ATPase